MIEEKGPAAYLVAAALISFWVMRLESLPTQPARRAESAEPPVAV